MSSSENTDVNDVIIPLLQQSSIAQRGPSTSNLREILPDDDTSSELETYEEVHRNRVSSSEDDEGSKKGSQSSLKWGWFKDYDDQDASLQVANEKDMQDCSKLKQEGHFSECGDTDCPTVEADSVELSLEEDTEVHETEVGVETKGGENKKKKGKKKKKRMFEFVNGPLEFILNTKKADLEQSASIAVTAPTYILEESISSQQLWKDTAGTRPPQPVEERDFYERMWTQNFEKSQVKLNSNKSLGSCDKHNKTVKDCQTGDELKVLVKGDNKFGTTASKTFLTTENELGPVAVSISIASYRVVELKNQRKYAQFHVIFRAGNFRDTVGVWKRYSDFDKLSHDVTHSNDKCASVFSTIDPFHITDEDSRELMPNAITSWSLVKKRQQWHRCLDASYLSIKAFLLERFLHDILYESSSPDLLRDFVRVSVGSD